LFRRLRTEAPNARILVLGYPHLFWDRLARSHRGGGLYDSRLNYWRQ
jgi:hypothetical protein